MSEPKINTEYEPTTEDLKEAFIISLENEIADLRENAIKDLDFFSKYEDRIYKIREDLSSVWSLIYAYKKAMSLFKEKIVKPEVK